MGVKQYVCVTKENMDWNMWMTYVFVTFLRKEAKTTGLTVVGLEL